LPQGNTARRFIRTAAPGIAAAGREMR